MTEYTYRNWEADKGLEDLQAEVFNEANQYKFVPANGDQIKQEYEQERIDPRTVRYAFEGKRMVAYMKGRVREKSKEVHLSFPWAVEGTPQTVQQRVFSEMMSYFQENYPSYKLRVNAMANPKENLDFLEKYGFVKKNVWRTVYFSPQNLAEGSYKDPYTSKIGSEEDIDALITLIKEDGRYTSQFPKDDDIRSYLKKVFEIGHLVMIFEKEELIAASAPLLTAPNPEADEIIIQRFTAYKYVKEQRGSIPLLIELAMECIASGYGHDNLFSLYTDDVDSPQDQREFLSKLTPQKTEILMYYYYLEEKK